MSYILLFFCCHRFTVVQPQTHSIDGVTTAPSAQILPPNNLSQRSIAQSNAGSSAIYIASGPCIEQQQNTKVKSALLNGLPLFEWLFLQFIFETYFHWQDYLILFRTNLFEIHKY